MTNPEHTTGSTNVHNVQVAKIERIETFSPVKVAKSIGVSESSLKRWCDAGHLNAIKTAGGHRRVTRSEVVRFVKQRGMMFTSPEMIGLPSLENLSIQSVDDGVEQLRQTLLAADDLACQRLLTFLYLEGREISEIVDLFLTPAFASIGDGWSSGKVEVYEERRACQTCSLAIQAIKTLVPAPAPNALKALGCAIESDQYSLPTAVVELTLMSLGWNAQSLGSNIPLISLARAATVESPDLVWLSASFLTKPAQAASEINLMASQLPRETTLVVGGNAITPEIRSQLKNVICCDNQSQLAAYAKSIQARHVTARESFVESSQ